MPNSHSDRFPAGPAVTYPADGPGIEARVRAECDARNAEPAGAPCHFFPVLLFTDGAPVAYAVARWHPGGGGYGPAVLGWSTLSP